jgi:hypothetical protein
MGNYYRITFVKILRFRDEKLIFNFYIFIKKIGNKILKEIS